MNDIVPPAEFERARAWRLARDLTMDELAARIGYSAPAISCFERGLVPAKPPARKHPTPITPRAWQRYKLLCAAVDHRIRNPQAKEFAW